LFFALILLSSASSAWAQISPPPGPNGMPNGMGNTGGSGASTVPSGKKDENNLFDQSSPYLEYGDFNSNEDEDTDTLYYQYGRFFGISLGLGYESATGNRGKIYNSAFPRVDIALQYWFDFNFAMDLDVFFANHSYTYNGSSTAVKLIGYGMDIKYYFDVRNASAPLSFANPFLIFGAGAISKSETSVTSAGGADSTFSVGLGAGLEFPISYRKTYFTLQGKYNTQSFADTVTTNFQSQGAPDLSGGFFSLSGGLLFVW
jgi:hypothetical protein